MNGFLFNIEQETLSNTDYRRVLYTTKNLQLVLMSIQPGEDIGEETHTLDQFIRIESGTARVVLNDVAQDFPSDFAVIIPAGVKHNIINSGQTPLQLYTLYTPPEHKDGIVVHTKAAAVEEHFDGKTSE